MSTATTHENRLGAYLKDRRAKLDPASFGLPLVRRRTPGSGARKWRSGRTSAPPGTPGWSRGAAGAPSADVLDRIAGALMLTDVERQHLFLLGLGHPPEVRYQAPEGISPRLQRVLDALEVSPALVKTPLWGCHRVEPGGRGGPDRLRPVAAGQRNILRGIFCNPRVRAAQTDWEGVARSWWACSGRMRRAPARPRR
ncbi:MAG: hypothetical protein WDM84_08345 [Bauldia sp.]